MSVSLILDVLRIVPMIGLVLVVSACDNSRSPWYVDKMYGYHLQGLLMMEGGAQAVEDLRRTVDAVQVFRVGKPWTYYTNVEGVREHEKFLFELTETAAVQEFLGAMAAKDGDGATCLLQSAKSQYILLLLDRGQLRVAIMSYRGCPETASASIEAFGSAGLTDASALVPLVEVDRYWPRSPTEVDGSTIGNAPPPVEPRAR